MQVISRSESRVKVSRSQNQEVKNEYQKLLDSSVMRRYQRQLNYDQRPSKQKQH